MNEKRLISSVRREIDREHKNVERRKEISKVNDKVEFVNSRCYCSDHSEHGEFSPIGEDDF